MALSRTLKDRNPNPLRIPQRPKNFFSLSKIKPTTVLDDEDAFYQQFVDYETSGSIDYEAAWLANYSLMRLPLQIDDYYSIRQSYFVDNQNSGCSDILIKLNTGTWLMARCYRGGLNDPRSTFKLHTYGEMAKLSYWNALPYIGDGYTCSATWSSLSFSSEPPEDILTVDSTAPLDAGRALAPQLVVHARQHLVAVKLALKSSLYAPAWWQLFANFLPFFEVAYGLGFDPEYEVKVEQVIMDVVSVALVIVPGGTALARSGTKLGWEMIVMQALRRGLTGRALMNYVALQVSKVVPEFVRNSFLLMTRMLIEIICPLPLPTLSRGFRVKPVKLGNVAGSGNLAFVRNPSALVPTEANRLAFTPLNDAFQMTQQQRPTGVYLRADLRGNRFQPEAGEGPSSAALAPSADLGLSLVLENIDQAAPWKYVLKTEGKSYGLVFDQDAKQFRLIYPDDWTQRGPLVYYTADGWRQSPMLGAARAASESKAILKVEPGLSQVRARVLRADVRAGRKSGRESLTVALKVLKDPEASPSVNRLLDMFMGQHSPALKSELKLRMQNSLAAFRRLRASKDVFYRRADANAVMSVPGGESFEAPQVVNISWYGKRTVSPADNIGGRQPYMMNVYAEGVQALQDYTHKAYPNAFARSLIHESFHMVNDTVIDLYAAISNRGFRVERIVSNATSFLKTSDAAGNVVNLPLNEVATLPKYEGAVRFALPHLVERFTPGDSQFFFKGPGGRLNVEDIRKVFNDKSELEDVLRHVRDNVSPAMKDNPDSYSFVVLGLEKLRKRPDDIKKLLDDYDYVLEHGPGPDNPLVWPF